MAAKGSAGSHSLATCSNRHSSFSAFVPSSFPPVVSNPTWDSWTLNHPQTPPQVPPAAPAAAPAPAQLAALAFMPAAIAAPLVTIAAFAVLL
jgi:hypothetical protein